MSEKSRVSIDMLFSSEGDFSEVSDSLKEFKLREGREGLVRVACYIACPNSSLRRVEGTIDHCEWHERLMTRPRVTISGSSGTNELTGIVRSHARVEDLVIGVPIATPIANEIGRLSSVLSTVERNQLYPVLGAPLNAAGVAAEIAYRFLTTDYDGPVQILREGARSDTPHYDMITELSKTLESYGMNCEITRIDHIDPNGIVVTNVSLSDRPVDSFIYDDVLTVDDALKEGTGVQIVLPTSSIDGTKVRQLLNLYEASELQATGFAGIGAVKNTAIIAAQLTQSETALSKIKGEREEYFSRPSTNPSVPIYEDY